MHNPAAFWAFAALCLAMTALAAEPISSGGDIGRTSYTDLPVCPALNPLDQPIQPIDTSRDAAIVPVEVARCNTLVFSLAQS